jgi:hypothetical protein
LTVFRSFSIELVIAIILKLFRFGRMGIEALIYAMPTMSFVQCQSRPFGISQLASAIAQSRD